MSLFDQYLKNRETQNATTEAKAEQKGFVDETMWKPKYHKETGQGYAVVRFLPGLDPTVEPWVITYDHYFKSPITGETYWEKSLSTIGLKDPLGKINSRLWNHGDEKYKKICQRQKRRTSYVANVLVIEDPDNPDAEGKVFKYKFGKKVFEKIQGAMKPEFKDEKPIKPFDMFEGANFKIKIRTGTGKNDYPNYDNSGFVETTGPISKDEDKMREIYESQHDLKYLLDPNEFKSYEELEERLLQVIGDEYAELLGDTTAAPADTGTERMDADSFGVSNDTPTSEDSSEPAEPATSSYDEPATSSNDEDDDELADFFSQMDLDD